MEGRMRLRLRQMHHPSSPTTPTATATMTMSTAMATADTSPVDTFEAIFQADEKTSEALTPVLELLKEMQEEGDEKSLSCASATVWIASRDEAWRIPIGDSGILDFFQSLIPTSGEPTLTLNSLKIVGNVCAEKDTNRKRVIEHPLSVAPVIAAINDPETRVIAAVVLANICTDYEPSQLAAIEKDACQTIFSVLSDDDFDDDLDYFLRILELLLSHDTGKAATPESALETLLEYLETGDEGFDNTLSLVSILSSLLTIQRFQKLTLTKSDDGALMFPRILDLVEKTYQVTVDAEREAKDKSLVAYARNQLVEAVGEIATDTEFLEVNPLGGEVMERVSKWLQVQAGKEELAVAACLVYGNVGRSDGVCIQLVETGVHKPLLQVVEDTAGKFEESVRRVREKKKDDEEEDVQVEQLPTGAMSVGIIHAAVGVLKNLAIPPENKKLLVDASAFKAIRRMLEMEGVGVGQVWYSAVSLGRLLIVNSAENSRLLISAPSPAETLLNLFLKRYTEVEELPVKTEISRTIAGILRVIYSDEQPNQPLLDALLSHDENVEKTLWDMVKQEKYPVVSSEGWFALAMLAREPKGAGRVVEKLEEELVRKTLEEGQGKDRDNVGVLVVELRKNSEVKRETTDELMRVFFRLQGVVFE
ncbi:ARM repeat-containing protein [Wilcoxina mikolae CBS 423.85]|nr:ARM repeat-containing protein [Wilcoxina mikolae CBS 423.85]